MKTNPIQQIITSTSRFDGPYLLLVQHSLAFSQRHSAHVDREIYKRANVRTPSQNACRDSMGSTLLEYILERYVAATGSVLWVETNQTVGISMSKSIRVLSAAVNPFGWDGPEGDTLENLQNLYDSIVACTSPEKSNTIVFAKNGTLISSGTGQTSRVDALMQAIDKANAFGFDLNGASMASDAFFPFPDCVELAKKAGITAVIQPGGSIKDQLSIDYCNENKLAMVFTGTRHFKH